jgi:hypothetical protein
MTLSSAHLAAILLAALLLGTGGCANDSPAPGEGCVSVGGVCRSGVCGESVPYPCPGNESCCIPSADAGSKSDSG